MAENAAEKATSQPAPPPKKADEEFDRAHIPMGEEFDKAKWRLPPWQPVAVALAIVAIALAIVAWVARAKPVAAGSIDNVNVAQVPPGDSVMVAINLTVNNAGQKTLWIHSLKAQLKTDKGEWSDDAASAVDFDRYFQGFPDLKPNTLAALPPETRIPVGGQAKGTIIVSFPVSKDAFEQRKSLSVTIQPYDQRAVVLTK